MATAAIEHARREQAFRDYCNLEVEGINPNPNALYKWYIQMNQDNPELRARIPTTNRTTVYEWAKEDRWRERYAELKQQESDLISQKYESIRENSYGKLVSFQNDALNTILELAQNSSDQKVRLQAAESILDRTGLGKVSAKPQKSEVGEKPEVAEADMLPADATPEQVQKWIIENSGSSMNA